MNPDPAAIASDWITYARLAPDSAPDEVFDRGRVLCDAAFQQPALAWDVIKLVIQHFDEADLFSTHDTDAQHMSAHRRRAA